MQERALYTGSFKIRRHPQEWTDKEFEYWWCDERDERGCVIRPARMSQREKDRYNEVLLDEWGRETDEIYNLITNNGITILLNNAAFQVNTSMIPFTQILEVGSGSISGVARTDIAIAGALTPRKAPANFITAGTQVDISFAFLAGDAVATWTNVGLWGNGATTTAGTGVMMTHALFTYVKASIAVTFDYFLTISN